MIQEKKLPVLTASPNPTDPAAAPAAPAAPALFSAGERAALLSLARAVSPAGERVSAPGPEVVERVEAFFASMPGPVALGYRAGLGALQGVARLLQGAPLAAQTPEELERVCARLYGGGFAARNLLRLLVSPLKLAHYDDARRFREVGVPFRAAGAKGGAADLPRFVTERTLEAAALDAGEVLECDAVVVGSGAGGAVAARELAEAGHAVLLLEEGPYHTRGDFSGRFFEMQRRVYRDMGSTSTVGNTVIPVPVGRGVGGTTTVNSGTCYRMPSWVLKEWREQHGLSMYTDAEMAPCYERVEQVLGVTPAAAAQLGGVVRVVQRGADRLGLSHGPLSRNAPDCDGQGVCMFGCPTDAKRSTNVSYVPLALKAGAQLLTGARVRRILVERGRAVGVEVEALGGGAGDGAPRRFTVRARAVVLAAGALHTPALLLGDAATRAVLARSGQLGRNLSIHPAAAVFAVMPKGESVQGWRGIPQGYAIEEFHREGLLLEGIFAPLDLGAVSITPVGRRFTELMEGYERLASFGFLLEERSRGRVRAGPGGRPLLTYYLDDHDVARVKRGVELLMRLFLTAGAESVLPLVHGFDEVRGEAELARFRAARLRARDFELTAYHPLGTARMGIDRRSSVVGPDLQAHDLPGLFLCDGSVLPTSPAVNPQVTIMAVATRGARRLASRLHVDRGPRG